MCAEPIRPGSLAELAAGISAALTDQPVEPQPLPEPGSASEVLLALEPGKVVIGIGGLAVRRRGNGVITTHALGSCIGLTAYDGVAGVGGMLHAQLPCADEHPERALSEPSLFVDRGLRKLLASLTKRGALPARLRLVAVGGAEVTAGATGRLAIGTLNCAALEQALAANSLRLAARDLGGHTPRTLHLDLLTGATTVESAGRSRRL